MRHSVGDVLSGCLYGESHMDVIDSLDVQLRP